MAARFRVALMCLAVADLCACNTALRLSDGSVRDADIDGAGTAGQQDAEICCSAVLQGVFVPTGSMNLARDTAAGSATLLGNGKVLIAGGDESLGNNGSVVGGSAELYDPANGTFTATGSMSGVRSSHTATLLGNGKVLIAGGREGTDCRSDVGAELYDATSGTFVATGAFVATGGWERGSHTATLLPSGQVLVTGGAPLCGVLGFPGYASAELYDVGAGTFTATGAMTEIRLSHTATLLADGRVLVAGGMAGSEVYASAELYDPAAGTFTSTGSMTVARAWHTATLLGDGRVLIAGGGVFETSAELYDPGTGRFTSTGSMISSRNGHTATLLCDGKVLITGGEDATGNAIASAELYDPGTGMFSATNSMVSSLGRNGHTATLLCNGKVLIAGGGDATVNALASAELYE